MLTKRDVSVISYALSDKYVRSLIDSVVLGLGGGLMIFAISHRVFLK